MTFKEFDQKVREGLTEQESEFQDHEDMHGCYDAEWTVEETIAEIKSVYSDFVNGKT
jgi:hypothetical protein